MEDEIRLKNVGKGLMQEVIFKAQSLNCPACTPDIRAVRDTVRGFPTLLIQSFFQNNHGPAYGFGKRFIIYLIYSPADDPSKILYVCNNKICFREQEIFIFVFPGGQIQFNSCLNLGTSGILVRLIKLIKASCVNILGVAGPVNGFVEGRSNLKSLTA